jgi:hypothetical protein
MTTPLRVFCPGPLVPSVAAIMAFARAHRHALLPFEDYAHDDPSAVDWDSAGFVWRPDRPPLFVELERPDGADGPHVARSVAAARRALDRLPASPARDEALKRLIATRYVAAIHVPTNGVDEGGWQAAEAIAACFEAGVGGQAGVTEVLGRGFLLAGEPI